MIRAGIELKECEKIHRRDTENTERAQSRHKTLRNRRVRSTSSAICVLCVCGGEMFPPMLHLGDL